MDGMNSQDIRAESPVSCRRSIVHFLVAQPCALIVEGIDSRVKVHVLFSSSGVAAFTLRAGPCHHAAHIIRPILPPGPGVRCGAIADRPSRAARYGALSISEWIKPYR